MKKISNRDHVIASASALFLQKGLMNTSMDDVVAQSKVSKSNIYYHFKSKEELVVAVLDYRVQLLRTVLDEIAQSRDWTAARRIEQIFAALADELNGRDCVGGCPILSLLSAQIPQVRVRIHAFMRELQGVAEKVLREGVERKEFKAGIPVPETAALLITILEGAMQLAESYGNTEAFIKAGATFLHLIQV